MRWLKSLFACRHAWVIPFRDVEGDVGPKGRIVFVCHYCMNVLP